MQGIKNITFSVFVSMGVEWSGVVRVVGRRESGEKVALSSGAWSWGEPINVFNILTCVAIPPLQMLLGLRLC